MNVNSTQWFSARLLTWNKHERKVEITYLDFNDILLSLTVKFPYNAGFDWLKQSNAGFQFFASEFWQISPKLNNSCKIRARWRHF